MYSVDMLRDYPEKFAGTVPSDIMGKLSTDYPYARHEDLVLSGAQSHYEAVARAYNDSISRDVNGNNGLAFARVFADEHPYLQNELMLVAGLALRLRHPELERCFRYGSGIQREHLDGRISDPVARFAALDFE